jgi:hypothetical protein
MTARPAAHFEPIDLVCERHFAQYPRNPIEVRRAIHPCLELGDCRGSVTPPGKSASWIE